MQVCHFLGYKFPLSIDFHCLSDVDSEKLLVYHCLLKGYLF